MSIKMHAVVTEILAANGLLDHFLNSPDNFHITLTNGSFLPLGIERHGDEVCVTHWVEQNGDWMRDPEMVFSFSELDELVPSAAPFVPISIEPGRLGRALPVVTVVPASAGQRAPHFTDRGLKAAEDFAAMWADNLRWQGFVRRYERDELTTAFEEIAAQHQTWLASRPPDAPTNAV